MNLRILFIIIIFISAAILGLWLFETFTEPLPESIPPRVEAVKPPPPTPFFERDEKIQSETDALLPLFDRMPPVPVYLKDEVINREGTNTERGVAYTTCENDQPMIYVKKVFYQKANRKQLVNILKHELTHAWQCRQRYTWGHDERFRKKFKQVGGFGN